MLVRRPNYYDSFHCIAGDCPATCCAGWEIGIDSKTMARYDLMEGAFGNRLHNSINRQRSSFLQYDKKCIFLNEDQLCDIYQEAGPDWLCRTCKTYPRHVEVYQGEKDCSLVISCPEVARIILSNPDKVYWTLRKFVNKNPVKEDKDFDEQLYRLLKEARKVSLDLLQNREIPIRLRMSMTLALSHDLQRRIYGKKEQSIPEVLAKYSNPRVIARVRDKLLGYRGREEERLKIMKKMLKTISHLKVLNPEWKDKVQKARKIQKNLTTEEYIKQYHLYHEGQQKVGEEMMLEQLTCYFVMNYYCTAVYDRELYSKMKFSIFSVLVIQEMNFLQWLQQENQLSFEDIVCNAYQYGREVEHLDENLEELDKIFINPKKYHLEEFIIGLL